MHFDDPYTAVDNCSVTAPRLKAERGFTGLGRGSSHLVKTGNIMSVIAVNFDAPLARPGISASHTQLIPQFFAQAFIMYCTWDPGAQMYVKRVTPMPPRSGAVVVKQGRKLLITGHERAGTPCGLVYHARAGCFTSTLSRFAPQHRDRTPCSPSRVASYLHDRRE